MAIDINENNEPVIIQVMKDGPLVIKGKFSITYSNNEKMRTTSMTSLCRCGESNNMPFCDGYHRKAGFCSDEE